MQAIKRNKIYFRSMLLMIIGIMLITATPVFGDAKLQMQDRKANYGAKPDYNFALAGDRLVYVEKDKDGIPQVYVRSVKNGKPTQITKSDTFKTNIKLRGDDIFFLESTIPVTKNINVYKKNIIQYNLKTKETKELLEKPGYPEYLDVEGDDLVYSTGPTSYYLLNLKTMKSKTLDKSYKVLDLAQGKLLVRKDYPDFTLYTYDVKTDKATPIVKMKDNQTLLRAAFNGNHAVWFTETKIQDETTKKYQYLLAYTIVDLKKPDAKPKTINLSAALDNAPNNLLSMGTNYVVWAEKVNNKYIARGMDLRTQEIFTYGDMNKNRDNFLYFVGDELLMKDADGKIFGRSVVRK